MGGAFLYLTVCSLRNQIRRRISRLREPRYLFGAVAGLGYLYFVFLRPRRGPGGRPAFGLLANLAAYRAPVEVVGGTLLLVVAALAWVLPGSNRPALTFSRADVQFLFPAPVTRRQLLHYKILRSQFAAIVGSAVMTLVFRPANLTTGWMFFAGMLVVTATTNLYLTGTSLRRQSLREHGLAGILHHWRVLTLVVSAVAVIGGTVAADWARLSALSNPAAFAAEVERLGATGIAHVVLIPFVGLVRLPFSRTPAEFLRALPLACAVLVANYLWVLRSDTAFEEASADQAEKTAERRGQPLAPVASRRAQPAPFMLAPEGRPEVALLWKNLILVGRYASFKMLLRLAPLVIIGGGIVAQTASTRGAAHAIGMLCLFGAGATVLLGPQMVRNDLRQDLVHLEVLKAWPVKGRAIVGGEVLAPTAILSAIVWLLVAGAASLSARSPFDAPLEFYDRVSYAVGAMLVAPGLILAQVILQNAIAVMFPDWASIGNARARGVEAVGQRMVMMAGLVVTLAVVLLPAAAVGALLGFGIYSVTHVIPVIVPAAAIAAALVIEAAFAVEILGGVFDRTDVNAVTLAE